MGSVGPGSIGPSAFSGSQVESLPGPGSRSVGPGPIGEAPAAPVRSACGYPTFVTGVI